MRSTILAAAGLVGLGLPTQAATGPVTSFVFNVFQHAAYDGEAADCPDGVNANQLETYLSSVPAADRDRLLKELKPGAAVITQKDTELYKIIYGTQTKNRCLQPTEYPDPGIKTLQGHVAYGINLDGTADGAATANSCAHQKFAGPNGEPGVDNQFWRVFGCVRMYGQGNMVHSTTQSSIHNGEITIVAEISGMQDPLNDKDVEVGLYSSQDPVIADGAGNVVSGASFAVHDNPLYHNHLHGRIVNGVLTTDPGEVHLELKGGPLHTQWFIKDAHLRLELQPDGQAKGMLAGYADVETTYQFTAEGTVDGSVVGGYTCPGIYGAMHRLADGYPDPKTGKCTAISGAWEIKAVPAFVIHPDDKKTADAGTQPVSAKP